MSRGIGIAAAVVIGLILIKDGSAGAVVQNSANVVKSLATGVKPLTTIA